MSVDIEDDLEAVSSFISSANYPNQLDALEAELIFPALHKSFLIDSDVLRDDEAQAKAA